MCPAVIIRPVTHWNWYKKNYAYPHKFSRPYEPLGLIMALKQANKTNTDQARMETISSHWRVYWLRFPRNYVMFIRLPSRRSLNNHIAPKQSSAWVPNSLRSKWKSYCNVGKLRLLRTWTCVCGALSVNKRDERIGIIYTIIVIKIPRKYWKNKKYISRFISRKIKRNAIEAIRFTDDENIISWVLRNWCVRLSNIKKRPSWSEMKEFLVFLFPADIALCSISQNPDYINLFFFIINKKCIPDAADDDDDRDGNSVLQYTNMREQ